MLSYHCSRCGWRAEDPPVLHACPSCGSRYCWTPDSPTRPDLRPGCGLVLLALGGASWVILWLVLGLLTR